MEVLTLSSIDIPTPLCDGVQFDVLSNEAGVVDAEMVAMWRNQPVDNSMGIMVWLVSPQETGYLNVSPDAASVVWQDASIEGRIVWRGLLLLDGTPRHMVIVNLLPEVERPVIVCALLPDGTVAEIGGVTVSRFVSPPPS